MDITPFPAQMIVQMEYEKGFHDGYRQAMREMPEIVRCNDCESFWQEEVVDHFTGEKKIAICCGKGNRLKSRDWFCADGKRKDNGDE